MSANPPFIQLDGIAKRWGESTGVARIDLRVARGEFIVLLGPSGCGKSTTLRMLAGLETPSAGRILIDERDVTHAPPAERRLSMVFQSYALFPHLTVAQNITFGLSVRGMKRREREAALSKAVALTGLQGLEGRKPSALSGGQRQRVALARAIVAGHDICLMDEPLSNLDAKLRHAVRQEIRTLQRELGMTVLYVTHDQTEAMGMADRIVLMNGGRVEQAGTPDALYEEPASAFAAAFIGSPPMAILKADAVPPALRPDLPPSMPPARALVGVRPEHIAVGAPTVNAIPATVRDVEFLGAETLVYLVAEHHAMIARLPGRATFEIGSTVGVNWPRDAAHAFDRDDGGRIAVTERRYDRRDLICPAGQAALTG